MKLGIGVTTYNRTKILELALSKIAIYWPDYDTKLVVSDDSTDADIIAENKILAVKYGAEYLNDGKRKGIANNKNKCLLNLKECDYIILFDDDCFPIKKGWFDFLINAHKKTCIHHFNLLDSQLHYESNQRSIGEFTVIECINSGGVMMFLTNDVIKKVGAFNKEYGLYGFEHCSYSKRIERSGLQNGFGANVTLHDIYNYIFSIDYGGFEVNPGHKHFNEIQAEFHEIGGVGRINQSSMIQSEVQPSISINSSIFYADLSGPIYREF